jgi:cytochrome oxidase assembly protein ShyY1
VRFLFTRRWLLFALAVVVLAYGTYWLGEWQFHRLADRKERNARTEQNLRLPAAPVDEVLAVGRPVRPQDEWRRVRASGTYLPQERIIVRYQTRDGASGVDVVTPLETKPGGPLLLVDRGWVATENAGTTTPDVPPPPAGEVTVVGWVRADATGDATTVTDGSTRAVSSSAIAATLDQPVYGGFVDAERESPAPAEPLLHAEAPDLSNGPHFFYGLQWWFFGLLAVFGFGYLAWDERRKLRRSPSGSDTAGSDTAGSDTAEASDAPERQPDGAGTAP